MAVPAMTAAEAYERYCAWCRSIGLAPAAPETWARVSRSLPQGFYQLAAEQKAGARE